ncbi:hypothetical protein NE865_08491 [Phthorimaea operculella]|nr:hypothetical protein NE865_08491 [Phthorimaea operculella]
MHRSNGSGSQPDLSKVLDPELCRKRKLLDPEESMKEELNKFRIEMLQILREFGETHNKKLDAMSVDILSTIRKEIKERYQREKNVVVFGLPETHIEDPKERIAKDKEEITKVMKTINPEGPLPVKMHRIGKYNQGKNRPIKLHKEKRAIVFGDFNFNLLVSDPEVVEYVQTLTENNYFILNNIHEAYFTRKESNKKSILDHVCSNIKDLSYHIAIVESSMSDHKHIYLEMKKQPPNLKTKIQYETINYETLYKSVQCETDRLFADYEELERTLITTIKKNKELKTKILNAPRDDWINKSIITGINRRNLLWKEVQDNPKNENLKAKFKKERNKVFNEIQDTKSDYYIKSFKKCEKKPLKMWKLINELSNNKTKQNNIPSQLKTKDGLITDLNLICEHFNIYFATIGTALANQIPAKYHTMPDNLVSQTQTVELSQIDPTSPEEVIKIIDNLKNNTSSGIDGITTKQSWKPPGTLYCLFAMKEFYSGTVSSYNRIFPDIRSHREIKSARLRWFGHVERMGRILRPREHTWVNYMDNVQLGVLSIAGLTKSKKTWERFKWPIGDKQLRTGKNRET